MLIKPVFLTDWRDETYSRAGQSLTDLRELRQLGEVNSRRHTVRAQNAQSLQTEVLLRVRQSADKGVSSVGGTRNRWRLKPPHALSSRLKPAFTNISGAFWQSRQIFASD